MYPLIVTRDSIKLTEVPGFVDFSILNQKIPENLRKNDSQKTNLETPTILKKEEDRLASAASKLDQLKGQITDRISDIISAVVEKELREIQLSVSGVENQLISRRIRPWMKNKNGQKDGLLSGVRSALTIIDGPSSPVVLKLKGCGNWGGPINVEKDHAGEPLGGQSLTYAKNDTTATKLIGDLFFLQEGLRPVLDPLGVVTYQGFEFEGEPCGAGVYRSHGDTRISELIGLLLGTAIERKMLDSPRFNKHVEDMLEKIGVYSGSLVNLLYRNGLIWGTRIYPDGEILSNAHAGNFVLMQDKEKLKVGLVDFDAGSLADTITSNDKNLYRMIDHLSSDQIESLRNIYKDVHERLRRGQQSFIARKYMQIVEHVLLGSSFQYNINLKDDKGRTITPENWLAKFGKGFKTGFSNPNFSPIPFDYNKLIREVTEALTSISKYDLDLFNYGGCISTYKSRVKDEFNRHSVYGLRYSGLDGIMSYLDTSKEYLSKNKDGYLLTYKGF